ncbi:MAG: hypothetical protein ACRC6T_03645 [Sarcina sp.]
MEGKWSLDELYTGFDSAKFKNDCKKLEDIVAGYKEFVDSIIDSDKAMEIRLESYVKKAQELNYLTSDLFLYTQLTLSVDTKNDVALKTLENLQKLVAKLADTDARISKWIGSIENIEEITKKTELLKEHSFHFVEIKEKSKYILSDKEELMIAKMQITGSSAFEKLMELETSSLLVDIELDGEKKQMPLTMVRNLAYDKDPEVRKTAYFAELKAYEKIENSVAASLCGIKGEVITTCEARGFESPLQDVLLKSRMSQKTLDAMFKAMKESLPVFEKFFRRKGEMLGHKNGLPFYDMFAPLEGGDKTYTLEEAKTFVFENFGTFSDRLRKFAETAFDKKWVTKLLQQI